MPWAPGKPSLTGLTLSSSSTGDYPPTTGSTGTIQPVQRSEICATNVKRRKSTCFGVRTPSAWIEIHCKYVDVRQSASIKRAQREMGSITWYFKPRKKQKTIDTVPPDLSQPKAPS